MTHQDKHAEVSLLFNGHTAPLGAVDTVALRATIEGIGIGVHSISYVPGEHVLLDCNQVQILIAGFDRPFPMEHFRGVSGPSDDAETPRRMLSRLAAHGCSLTVLVMDPADQPGATNYAHKSRICNEAVDLLLATASPDLVFWSNDDHLVTAAQAEAAIEGVIEGECSRMTGQATDMIQPRRPAILPGAQTLRPTLCSPLRAGDIDLGKTDFVTEAFSIRPRRPVQHPDFATLKTARPTHKWAEPTLSPDVIRWFEGDDDTKEAAPNAIDRLHLRSFLGLDESPEPRRMRETASGRASLYLMSATIAVFALPVGASMLTYNALSGGSFRATSYMMAMTGIGMALTGLGFEDPALPFTSIF